MELRKKTIYVFDTNALYDYIEASDSNSTIYGEQFRLDLKSKAKFIPSVCLMEVFVKHRKNPNYIKTIIETLFEENFYLSFSQPVSYTPKNLLEFLTASDDFLRTKFCLIQMEKKIQVESEILSLMEINIATQFAGSCAREYNLDENVCKIEWMKFIKEHRDTLIDFIKDNLQRGYNDSKEKQEAKAIWKAIMYVNFSIINAAAFQASQNKGSISSELSLLKQSYTKRINKALNLDSNGFQRMQRSGVEKYASYILNDIDVFIDSLRKNKKLDFTEEQLGYTKIVIKNWIIKGEALDKNDISDILYFYFCSNKSLDSCKIIAESSSHINKGNIRYISFDSDMYSYINKISPNSYNIISKYLKNPHLKY